MKSPFTYEIPASPDRIGELYDTLSPIEKMPDGVSRDDFIEESLAADATYSVLIDGRLAGVAFVIDCEDHREMAFAKTEYLTTSRRLTFARNIPALFADINRAEEKRLNFSNSATHHSSLITHHSPLYIHTPDGDDRSRDWFLKAGCVETKNGLRCPTYKETN